jgi:hypothetical protein
MPCNKDFVAWINRKSNGYRTTRNTASGFRLILDVEHGACVVVVVAGFWFHLHCVVCVLWYGWKEDLQILNLSVEVKFKT